MSWFFFDFDGISSTDDPQGDDKRLLVGLLPGRADGHAVMLKISRRAFLNATRLRQEIMPVQLVVQRIAAHLTWERLLVNATLPTRRPRKRQWKQWSKLKTTIYPKRRTARF